MTAEAEVVKYRSQNGELAQLLDATDLARERAGAKGGEDAKR